MKTPTLLMALLLAPVSVYAAKPCEELKTEIAAQIDANHVPYYTLEILANDQVGERKVVGSCDGGTKKIVYERQDGPPPASTAMPAPSPAVTPAPAPASTQADQKK